MAKKIAIFFAYIAFVSGQDIYAKCGDSINCAEQAIVKVVNDVDKTPVSFFHNSIVFEKTNAAKTEEPRAQEDLVDRLLRYITSHELKIKFPTISMRSLIDDARSSKIKKILLPLLLLLKLKAAIVIPAVLSAIALVAFKGLGAGLIAMAISGAMGFKTLLEGHGNSKLTYEVVPQISSPHWSRTGAEVGSMQGYYTVP